MPVGKAARVGPNSPQVSEQTCEHNGRTIERRQDPLFRGPLMDTSMKYTGTLRVQLTAAVEVSPFETPVGLLQNLYAAPHVGST